MQIEVDQNNTPVQWNTAVKFLMARKFDTRRALELYRSHEVFTTSLHNSINCVSLLTVSSSNLSSTLTQITRDQTEQPKAELSRTSNFRNLFWGKPNWTELVTMACTAYLEPPHSLLVPVCQFYSPHRQTPCLLKQLKKTSFI